MEKFSDEDLAFRPAANTYSVAETLLHIANEEDGEVRYGLTRELSEFPSGFEVHRYADKAAIIRVLDDVHARTIAYVGGLGDADLAESIETPWGAKGRRIEFLWHVIEHEVHHRGELSLMLGLLGREGLDA